MFTQRDSNVKEHERKFYFILRKHHISSCHDHSSILNDEHKIKVNTTMRYNHQQDVKWKVHVNNISTKRVASTSININITSISVKEQTYKSLVRPKFEYLSSAEDP